MKISKLALVAVVSLGAVILAGCGGEKSKQVMCEEMYDIGIKLAEKNGNPVPKELIEPGRKPGVAECMKWEDDKVKKSHKTLSVM